MKLFAILCTMAVSLSFGTATSAQKCYIPKPMTSEQIARVKGIWTGNYNYEGKQYAMTVKLYTNSKITCSVEGSPVKGQETGEQIRFCDGGEFHFKKMIGELSYEFQGTPKEDHIEGMLTVRKNDTRVGKNGRFQLDRTN
jgi:hypothetical protein